MYIIHSGMPGHIGQQCSRPILDVCARNEQVLIRELERAGTVSFVEENIVRRGQKQQQQEQRSGNLHDNNNYQRGRQPRRDETQGSNDINDRRQVKSMPPTRNRSDNSSNGSSNKRNNHGGENHPSWPHKRPTPNNSSRMQPSPPKRKNRWN
jgi:hypothetical protein